MNYVKRPRFCRSPENSVTLLLKRMFFVDKGNDIFIKERRSGLCKKHMVPHPISSGLGDIPFKNLVKVLIKFVAHTPANISSRGSSGFSFCNSLKISFDRSSCTFGTTICTSTI